MKRETNLANGHEIDPNNPITAAVLPLRADAMERAEQYARQIVAEVRAELKAANNDLEKCAPYPSGMNSSRAAYMGQLAKYQLFHKLCQCRASSRAMHEPNFADVNSNYVAKFVKEAREDAAYQYDAFIAKLIKKIGPVQTAVLQGNHVWGHSFLTVVTETGDMQIWKTQTIVNVSKLGKIFNQFPTRKVKANR